MHPQPIGPHPTRIQHLEQAKAKEGFDVANFRVDWGKKTVSCPRGRESIRWSETARGSKYDLHRISSIRVRRMPEPSFVHAGQEPPTQPHFLQPKEEHEAIQSGRRRQKTEDFTTIYTQRAGIEGTISLKVSGLSGCVRLASGA